MKSVMLSIQPKWIEKIVNGEKTIEVRKSAPKELRNFFTPMGKRPSYMIDRPPQSYMYVEEL